PPTVVRPMGGLQLPSSTMNCARQPSHSPFTFRRHTTPPLVMHADPAHVKEIFTAPPEVLHPGEGARMLEPVVGTNSVILLDEREHLSQRRLMLPAFHGEKMERLTDLMAEVADREVASWPRGEAVELHPRFQALTLEIILRTVFGLDAGERLEALRTRLTEILALGSRPLGMFPFLQRDFGGVSPWRRFLRLRDETDELIFDLIAERRSDSSERDDVLSML